MISFPDSVFILIPHHTARHTRILQRIALARSGMGANPTLVAAMLPKYSAVSPLGIPVTWKTTTEATEPIRFPSQHTTQSLIVSAQLTAFLKEAADITKLFPVNSSAPAITTRLSAEAKAKAWATFVQEAASPAEIIPPKVKATKLPKEINIPATIAEIKYPRGLFFSRLILPTPPFTTALYSSLNILYRFLQHSYFERQLPH